MKNTEEYKTTTNRWIYNRTRKEWLATTSQIHCAWCKYHKNENRTSRWYGEYTHFRDGRVESKHPNWKLVSKKSRQWQVKKNKRDRPTGFEYVW